MYEVLELVRDQHHGALVILQELQDALLHQVVTQVDVQRREGVVLGEAGTHTHTDAPTHPKHTLAQTHKHTYTH